MNKQEYRWGFWAIDTWLGRWSKTHAIKVADGVTLCGRWPQVECGSSIVYPRENLIDECCITCKQIDKTRSTNREDNHDWGYSDFYP